MAEERDFGAVTLSISADLLPTLKAKLHQLQVELVGLADRLENKEQVYQLNLQLFPASQKLTGRETWE